jgi:hypothetical protein
LRHEAALAWQVVYEGESDVRSLCVGRILRTDVELPDTPYGQVMIEVTHIGARNQAYRNTYKAIPSDRRFRLKIEDDKWPKITGSLSARITSSGGHKYAYLTEQGYYVARFDCDFGEWPAGLESVPLRLAKPFAGDRQTGFHFPVIEGTEAIIQFENGDPNRPYIAGFQHNSDQVDLIGLTGSAALKQNVYIDSEKDPVSGKQTKVPRRIDPEWKGRSPVIHFYWGYRAAKGHEQDWRVALRDVHGFDYWSPACPASEGPWYWGGGPFQNGTNNLQQLWSDAGFKLHVLGIFNSQILNTESDRQLQDAPPRTYYAHAVQRLADLIDKIRNHSVRDTITLMSHSQGTMIAMAATALCQTRAPDALFAMNSPFALDDKITDALQSHGDRPTVEARVNTFRNIANRIKRDKRVFTEEQMQQLHVGATHDLKFWRPNVRLRCGTPDRDNHGRFYVYFTPHDRVMGTMPLQSIGWQGVDDKLLEELGDTVKQRMLARCTPVGDEPGVKKFGTLPPIQHPMDGVSPDAFWNGNSKIAHGLLGMLWSVPNGNKTVTINAEKVSNPNAPLK